jgi:hypothetical protein
MTEANDPAPTAQQPEPDAAPPPPPPTGATVPAPAYAGQPAAMPTGAGGTIRSTGTCILLTIVTLGFYTWYWYYKTHEELKQHSGAGLGGAVALILAIFVGFVMPFITASEVGGLYERRGQEKPVSGMTGLWILLPLIGAIVWFVKTNGALNDYWRSVGVQEA